MAKAKDFFVGMSGSEAYRKYVDSLEGDCPSSLETLDFGDGITEEVMQFIEQTMQNLTDNICRVPKGNSGGWQEFFMGWLFLNIREELQRDLLISCLPCIDKPRDMYLNGMFVLGELFLIQQCISTLTDREQSSA
ncbi:hypothetical protein CMI45_02375 [Candidatus Pacearchaeota archaeon]|nr:hypothetical protein [Candidatus Pacearchaeota archaeon]|tara:strand:+ start:3496 stop:3900 length:405 start_codon:yes stop_codon:yes gene_type:complete